MTNNKNQILNIFIFAIVGGIYNVVSFLLIDDHDRLFWISYVFTMAAIVMPVIIQLRLFTTGAYPKKVFLGLPIVVAAFIYLVVQSIAGFVLMLLPDGQYKISIVVQIIILALFALFAIFTLMVKNNAESFEKKVEEKRFLIQSLASDIQGLGGKIDDAVVKKKLKALAEAVRFSDPMSHDSLAPLEAKIEALTAELEILVWNGDSSAADKIKEIEDVLAERNRKAKVMK